jgi:hypothetical protein
VLITLADIGRPTGYRELEPLAERVMQTWLAPRYYAEFETATSRHKQAKLHYPSYWYYDVLSAAKGLAEAGLLGDGRCRDGLDLLQSKRLPDGGWAAEGTYYNAPGARSQVEIVGWGGVNARKANEWVTVDALAVLHAARRL